MSFEAVTFLFDPDEAESVGLQFDGERLTLEVVDADGDYTKRVFDALAFRWTPPSDVGAPGEDGVHVARESAWIDSVVAEDGQVPECLRHWVICFSEQGRVLEIIEHVTEDGSGPTVA